MQRSMNRREMLKVGALGTGLTLSQYLGMRAAAAQKEPMRSAIFIFMEGAPSHRDTFDLKPEAPAEVRGEFRPIKTSVGGSKSVNTCLSWPSAQTSMLSFGG